jgi:hypothetical protein
MKLRPKSTLPTVSGCWQSGKKLGLGEPDRCIVATVACKVCNDAMFATTHATVCNDLQRFAMVCNGLQWSAKFACGVGVKRATMQRITLKR